MDNPGVSQHLKDILSTFNLATLKLIYDLYNGSKTDLNNKDSLIEALLKTDLNKSYRYKLNIDCSLKTNPSKTEPLIECNFEQKFDFHDKNGKVNCIKPATAEGVDPITYTSCGNLPSGLSSLVSNFIGFGFGLGGPSCYRRSLEGGSPTRSRPRSPSSPTRSRPRSRPPSPSQTGSGSPTRSPSRLRSLSRNPAPTVSSTNGLNSSRSQYSSPRLNGSLGQRDNLDRLRYLRSRSNDKYLNHRDRRDSPRYLRNMRRPNMMETQYYF